MFKNKKIAAWVLALAMPFGASSFFSNQASAKKYVKADEVYITAKYNNKDKKQYKKESGFKSMLRGIAAILGLTFVAGAVVFTVHAVNEDDDYSGYTPTRKTRTTTTYDSDLFGNTIRIKTKKTRIFAQRK